VTGQKATAKPRGTSRKASEVNKRSTAGQKPLAPKRTAKPTRSRHHASGVSITLTTHNTVICANRLLPSLIKAAAAKISNLLMKMRQMIPHRRRRRNLSLENWILCSTPLPVYVPRTLRTVTTLNGPVTSHIFSLWLKLGRRRSECANYARKSSITYQETY
jgi:hypothetical protein